MEVAAAERRFADERTAAFRREVFATVRCASPFLIALLEMEGRTLDQVAGELDPAPGWPRRPRIHRVVRDWARDPHALRHASAAAIAGFPYQEAEMLHNSGFPLAGGGRAYVLVVAHSLEVSVTIGGARFETRLGELRITLRRRVPAAIAAALGGWLLDEAAVHPLTVGRGWRIIRVEDVRHGDGTILFVETGSTERRLGSGHGVSVGMRTGSGLHPEPSPVPLRRPSIDRAGRPCSG